MRTRLALLSILLASPNAGAQTAGAADTATIEVPAGTRVSVVLQRSISTKLARPGDSIYMQTNFPVTVGNRIAIPAGTYVLATLDTVRTHGWMHPSLELRMHVASMFFANGYVANMSDPARSSSDQRHGVRPDGWRAPGLYTASAVIPVAATAVGAIADGTQGAITGGAIGSAVGLVTLVAAVSRGQHVVLDAGAPGEIVLQSPLILDARRVADAARIPQNVPPPVRPNAPAQRRRQECYHPGSPGTPDVVIPGDPGTPPIGDSPGTPPSPPIVIPGTPATAGYWSPCD